MALINGKLCTPADPCRVCRSQPLRRKEMHMWRVTIINTSGAIKDATYEEVQAPTADDAKSIVKTMHPKCIIRSVKWLQEERNAPGDILTD